MDDTGITAPRHAAASREGAAASHDGAAEAPRGDPARFEAIFRAHTRAVPGYARRRPAPDTAEEVAAAAFLVCGRRPDAAPADPRPWLFGVARRCLANRRRGAQRRQALEARVAEPATT